MDLFFDLRCGVSGDMLLSALVDWSMRSTVGKENIKILEEAASVQSPTRIVAHTDSRNGIVARKLHVEWDELEKRTCSGSEMLGYLEKGMEIMDLNDRTRRLSRRMLMNILEAEAAVHNEASIRDVHLHEAGTPDTLVDVLGIAKFCDDLEVDGYWVKATPVSLGKGVITTAHGIYDIPVPAVRHMLRSVTWRTGPVEGELATPTGMAAVNTLVEIWLQEGEVPGTIPDTWRRVGSGAGSRVYDGGFSNTLAIYEVGDR
ncbi:MAG: nickel insertion protein [Thermoplasmatota archaeon]